MVRISGGFGEIRLGGAVTFHLMGRPTGKHAGPRTRARGQNLAGLYARYSRALLKLTALLVADVAAAEDIVSDAFAALHLEQHLHRSDDILAFLHQAVVRGARAAAAARGGRPLPCPDPADALVIDALRAMPRAQREALVLRYYGRLSDEQAATAMGVREGELRLHVARGMAALRAALGPGPLAPGMPPAAKLNVSRLM